MENNLNTQSIDYILNEDEKEQVIGCKIRKVEVTGCKVIVHDEFIESEEDNLITIDFTNDEQLSKLEPCLEREEMTAIDFSSINSKISSCTLTLPPLVSASTPSITTSLSF